MKKSKSTGLSAEYLKMIRVKPEDTARRLANLPYTITPKPDEKNPRGKLWCPYCAKWSKYYYHKDYPYSSLTRCQFCCISIEDFHVKTVNHLWESKGKKSNR
ncbi:hypothetical protein M5X17_27775 [Paenibacillus alvei]|uniref:hypothetical protein n=1 Tax=Paenibacillus alvei TaxID=44250 RepID=UPI00227EFCDD|nr:hypothetical protein [Paenibacillus alvei]MCY9737506.1 hypothetical protein [Paenibacillus alvei]